MKNKKPNLLFIFTDEQAAKTMSCYGNKSISTPNMDRLANQSVLFENAYVTQSVCTPSRSSIMTGLYPHTNGCTANNIPLKKETKCFPELADFSDYKTGYFGKWHLGDEIFAQHGFEEWRSIEDDYYPYYSNGQDKKSISSYAKFLLSKGYKPDKINENGVEFFSREFATKLPEEHSKPMYLAGETTKFLEENKENPFILYVNFLEPHMPFTSQRDNQYDPKKIPLPESFNDGNYNTQNTRLNLFREKYYNQGQSGLPLKTKDDWKRMIANYWGMVSLVDSSLGIILEALESKGLSENTIIVYTSDHGDMMGAHRLIAKSVMNEEAIKVPLMIKIPQIQSRKIREPISQVDLVPTLLELMGKDAPKFLEGKSWLEELLGKKEPDKRPVFIEWNVDNNGVVSENGDNIFIPDFWKKLYSKDEIIAAITDTVRTVITADGWKYNHSRTGQNELYNLNEDPYEMNSLAQDSKYMELIEMLQGEIRKWQHATNDNNHVPV